MYFYNSNVALFTALLLAKAFASTGPFPKHYRQEVAVGVGDSHGEFAAQNPRSAFFREIVDSSFYSDHNKAPTRLEVPLKVGIVGAGAAGLYAAVLLDSLGIDYDIYEASDRIGGRIYTYRFDQETWDDSTPEDPAYYDYYDVGAMRFPPLPYMDRVIGSANWSLIPYINERVSQSDQVVQIPYYFTANNTFRKYNGVLVPGQTSTSPSVFNVQLSYPNGTVETKFDEEAASTVWSNLVQNMTAALSANFTSGFNLLMEYDSLSVRGYLLSQGFTNAEIDWLETLNDATGHYSMSMSQCVLDEWIFTSAGTDGWTAINGGMDMLTKGMSLIIKNKPILNSRVTGITPNATDGTLNVVVNGTDKPYAHVISTVPLGALQAINMTGLELDYFQQQAVRSLSYDPSAKIGFKFKSRWWENLPSGPFQGGQSYTDMPIRRCVYPSYGINITDAPGTMIASYVWAQDAARLGSYLNAHNPAGQAPYQPGGFDHLVAMTLQDLASLNNVSFDFLSSQLEGAHAYDWYQSEFSVGAFALFGPGQYSSVMPYLMTPAWDGHVHWGGEALSSGHAWIIGALNSAYRNVLEILNTEGLEDLKAEFVRMWNVTDEVDMGWYNWTPEK
ncbi:hypothetical protein VM1G_04950 [Cytospora mali]|uniref:Amine oxidase domain-containing protein n=1 Tax=Cytospora mali TaxID=578113 RepID=A0A194W032_CYTMA|nr:hypothetical protein VM1G_04950 [Valsa mali]